MNFNLIDLNMTVILSVFICLSVGKWLAIKKHFVKPPKIFLNYRRGINRELTNRLWADLAETFGREAVFLDTQTVELGEFPPQIDYALRNSDIVLAVIGDGWETIRNQGESNSKILREGDWVRRELAHALTQKIRIQPIFVEARECPADRFIPEDIRPVFDQQALPLRSEQDYENDLKKLVMTCRKYQKTYKGFIACLVMELLVGVSLLFAFASGITISHKHAIALDSKQQADIESKHELQKGEIDYILGESKRNTTDIRELDSRTKILESKLPLEPVQAQSWVTGNRVSNNPILSASRLRWECEFVSEDESSYTFSSSGLTIKVRKSNQKADIRQQLDASTPGTKLVVISKNNSYQPGTWYFDVEELFVIEKPSQ